MSAKLKGCFVASLVAAAQGSQLAAGGGSVARHLRPAAEAAEEPIIEPIRFHQQLLVCNTYPSRSPVEVQKNGRESLAGDEGIRFRECRYLDGEIQKKDLLGFSLQGINTLGTFEVGDLPGSDAILLLVVGKRPQSTMVDFQDFAFPPSGQDKDIAQIAIVNGLKGAATKLFMEDHIDAKEAKAVSKRVEQLSFNRVYSVEAGSYDASLDGSKQVVTFSGNQNYVLLRTGGEGFEESLVVFPPAVPNEAPKNLVTEWLEKVKAFARRPFAAFFGKH